MHTMCPDALRHAAQHFIYKYSGRARVSAPEDALKELPLSGGKSVPQNLFNKSST